MVEEVGEFQTLELAQRVRYALCAVLQAGSAARRLSGELLQSRIYTRPKVKPQDGEI